MASMGASIASAAGRGVRVGTPRRARVRAFAAGPPTPQGLSSCGFLPRGTAARAPGRTAATAATTATRAWSSRRGALTVTCAKKKNGAKGKGVKGKNAPKVTGSSRLKKESRAEKAFRQPGATSSSGDGVWDSIQVGGADGGVDGGADVDLDMSFDEEETDDAVRSTPGVGSSSSSTTSADGLMRSITPDEQISTPKALMTPKQRIRFALKRVDSDGYWALISSGIVFGTFLLESYNMSSFGGWDVLYRDDISWYTGLISMKDLEDIQDAYNILFACEFALRAWAADFKLEFWKNPLTLVDFAASVPPVLSFFELVSARDPVLRFLRLLRVVRLLRLLDNRDPDSTLFGLVKSNSMGIQLAGIGFEFVCIFIITAGIIYDLEYTTNPNVNDLNDTLYWAILTLTGIGQPFEVVTAGGRVATVMAIGVALIVVPGQLAKLATVAGAQDIIEGFMPDESYESYDEDEFQSFDEGDGWTALPAVNASMSVVARTTSTSMTQLATDAAVGGAQLASSGEYSSFQKNPVNPVAVPAPVAVGGFVPQSGVAMRQKMWDGRECDTCGLQIHEQDARFCRRCGGKLGTAESAGMLYVKRSELPAEIAAKKAEAAVKRERREAQRAQGGFGTGRLGMDIAGMMMRQPSGSRSRKKKGKSSGGKRGRKA